MREEDQGEGAENNGKTREEEQGREMKSKLVGPSTTTESETGNHKRTFQRYW